MNEKMRELAEKSGFQYIKDEGIGWAGNYNASLPKFAELIVKECMMLVEGFEITQEVALDEYVDYEASAVLKEHFGVEDGKF